MMTVTEPAGWTTLLADHSDEIATLARQLRETITAAVPDITERVYPGWHGIGFHHASKGYVFAIFPLDSEIRVGFEHGAELPDPDGLLTGVGSRVRYLRFTPGATEPTEGQLIELVDYALAR